MTMAYRQTQNRRMEKYRKIAIDNLSTFSRSSSSVEVFRVPPNIPDPTEEQVAQATRYLERTGNTDLKEILGL